MKKLALFDVDGVIYEGHTIFDQIQDQEARGIIAKGAWDKILVELKDYQSGKKTYTEAANAMLVIHAEALKVRNYQAIVDDTRAYFVRNKEKFFPYFAKLVSKIENEYDIYFVTTNFQFMCEAIGTIFGVKKYLSSIAEVRTGKFTGKVERSLAGNKGIAEDLISKYGKEGSIAVGDSENDADMLDKVEFPFVMEPNEKLKEISKKNGWKVVNRENISKHILSVVSE